MDKTEEDGVEESCYTQHYEVLQELGDCYSSIGDYNQEEFCQQILSDSYEPEKHRKFVENNYSLEDQLKKINGVFIQLVAEISSNKLIS